MPGLVLHGPGPTLECCAAYSMAQTQLLTRHTIGACSSISELVVHSAESPEDPMELGRRQGVHQRGVRYHPCTGSLPSSHAQASWGGGVDIPPLKIGREFMQRPCGCGALATQLKTCPRT